MFASARALIKFTLILISPLAVSQPAALVAVDEVVVEKFTEKIPLIGKLVAVQEGVVATRIGGTVDKMTVDVGSAVRAGQVVARLDDDLLAIKQRQAAARLAESESKLTTAKLNMHRYEKLRGSAAISESAFDDAAQQLNIAQAQFESAKAAAEQANLEFKYAQIRAPFGGVVAAKLTEVGAYLQRGAAVVRLVSDQRLEAEAEVPHIRMGGIRIGAPVVLQLDGEEYRATVRAVVPQEDPRTRTRRVRFATDLGSAQTDFSEVPKWLAAEQSVTILIPAGSAKEVLSVHKDAIVRRGGDASVFVVAEGVAQLRAVIVGAASGLRLAVLSGLVAGEQVIVRGNERLRSGQQVQIAK